MATTPSLLDHGAALLEETASQLDRDAVLYDLVVKDPGLVKLAFSYIQLVDERDLPPAEQKRYLLNAGLVASAAIRFGGEIAVSAQRIQQFVFLKLRAFDT